MIPAINQRRKKMKNGKLTGRKEEEKKRREKKVLDSTGTTGKTETKRTKIALGPAPE